MNLIEAFRKNVKNIFVGSHRGDDFILENIIKSEEKKMEKPNENENDFGVNPNEWFEEDHKAIDEEPLDLAPSSYEPPEDEPEDIHEQMLNNFFQLIFRNKRSAICACFISRTNF